jgi:microcystin-dependent protein
MAEPFVAEIRVFACNYAPLGWALCNGQLLSISQNTALFSLLGISYGGNGTTTFALPNLQGYAPMHQGQGTGLSPRTIGETSGSASVTLLTSDMPAHTHNMFADGDDAADNATPSPKMVLAQSQGVAAYTTTAPNVALAPTALPPAGGSEPHQNMQPYQTLNICIATQGIFPPRS